MPRTVLYCDPEDFLGMVPPQDLLDLSDDDGDGEADAGVIAAVIASACDEIDSFYAMRGVPVPLDTGVEVGAKQYAKYLSIAHLYGRRHLSPDRSGHGEMIKTVRQILTKIAESRVSVPSLKPSTGGTPGIGGVTVPGDGTAVDVVSEEAFTVPRINRILS